MIAEQARLLLLYYTKNRDKIALSLLWEARLLSSLSLNDLFFLSHFMNGKKGLFRWHKRKQEKTYN